MAAAIPQSKVSDIYAASVLADAAQSFVDTALEHVDLSQETIRKISYIVKSSPFHREQNGDCYQYHSHVPPEVRKGSHIWHTLQEQLPKNGEKMPEEYLNRMKSHYAIFYNNQKSTVKFAVLSNLNINWEALIKKAKEHGPLAYVTAEIELQIDTVNKENENQGSSKTYTTGLKICDEKEYAEGE